MQVLVVVFVFAALVTAKGIFHAATVVSHLVQQPFVGKCIEGAVQRHPIVLVNQCVFELRL